MSISEPLKGIVRVAPIQPRSSARIELLLDAAAEIITDTGIEGLTTSDVAARSKSSVGVVYRYFPHIRSLLQALALRNLERFSAQLEAALPDSVQDWLDGVDVAIDTYVHMMRQEPGFRAIRFGDLVNDRLLDPDVRAGGMLSQAFVSVMHDRYGFERSPELMFALEVCVEISEALIGRAFQFDADGDEPFIQRTRDMTRRELDGIASLRTN